jgi:hypothetical protein
MYKSILFLILLVMTNMNCNAENKNQEFRKIFQNEIYNREFAKYSLARMYQFAANQEDKKFFLAYMELESINYRLYEPYAKKYNLIVAVPKTARFKLAAAKIMYLISPKTLNRIMYEATEKHISGLKHLSLSSVAIDKVFFEYVLAQEEVQLDAYYILSENNDINSATKILVEFVSKYSSLESI